MSLSYEIRVPLTLLIDQAAIDKSCNISMPFELMMILSNAEMEAKLKEELLACGGKETADGIEMAVSDGLRSIIDVANRRIKISPSEELEEVGVVFEEDIWGRKTIDEFRDMLEKAPLNEVDLLKSMSSGMETSKKAAKNLLERKKTVMASLAALSKTKLNGALKKIYRDGLKEKASKMGNILNLTESVENGEEHIRIELSV